MLKEVGIKIEQYESIDYSPIYEITFAEDVKAGQTVRFDPATGRAHIRISPPEE